MKIAIVEYGAGNVLSLKRAAERLGAAVTITSDPKELGRADRILFPGQGEASSAMRFLKERGLLGVLGSLTQPFLGICLGLQVMCRASDEGPCECLGILPERVRRFETPQKVPHVGWNTLHSPAGPLFHGISEGDYVYFVHSYYVPVCAETRAEGRYGEETFSAAVEQANFFGVQFHPEKSGSVGMSILKNFLLGM